MAVTMSKNVEVWTQPETGTFTKKIADLPWARIGFNRGISIVGQGQIELPASYDRLDELIDPENNSGSMIRVWQDGQNVESFYADEVTFDEGKQGTVTISGPNIEHGLEKGVVYPWDWTPGATATLFPDWVYGVGSSIIQDISFDDSIQSPLVNGDFEKGDASGWAVFGKDPDDEDDPGPSLDVVNNPANAYEGNYFVIIDPTVVHGGLKQEGIRVYPNKTNGFSARVKGPGPIGDRITMNYRAEAGTVAATGSPYFQTYTNGEIQAELDNAVYETGATDGTWQEIIMNATWGGDQYDTDLYVQYDDHSKANGEVFWLDAFTMTGFGVGVGPWEAVGTEWMTVFEGSSFIAHSGTQSLAMSMSGIAQPSGAVGIRQPVEFEAGAPYTAEVWVWTPTGGSPTVRLAVSQADGGAELGSVEVDVVASTWTKLEVQVTPPEGILDGFIGLAWVETYAGTLYVDDFDVKDGLPAATAGKIVGDALTAVTTRDGGDSALLWLKWDSWDETYDTNGQLWGEELDMRVSRGMTIRQLLDRLSDWGIEWEVVWNVGSSQYELKLYKKFDGTTGGAGGASTVRLISGKSFRTGQVRLRDAGPNTFLAEGADGTIMEKQSAALEAGYGRVEGYISQGSAEGAETLESIIDTSLVESENQKFGIKAALFQRPFPLLDFDLGDRPEVNLPPHLPDDTYRVVGYTGAWDAAEDSDEYTLSFSTHVFDDPFGGTTSEATSAGLNYLLGKYEGLPDIDRVSGTSTTIGTVGAEPAPIERVPTFTVASSYARQYVKNLADFVCDGIDDQIDIQRALDALPSGGGRVVLTEGWYNCVMPTTGADTIVIPFRSTLQGMGKGTVLLFTGGSTGWNSGIALVSEARCQSMTVNTSGMAVDKVISVDSADKAWVSEVQFTGMSDNGQTDQVYLQMPWRALTRNCEFYDLGTQDFATERIGIDCSGGLVEGCYFEGGYDGGQIYDGIGLYGYGQFTGNIFHYASLWARGFSTSVGNNNFYVGGLVLDMAGDMLVTGNAFTGLPSGGDPDFDKIRFHSSCTGVSIVGNDFYDTEIQFDWNTTQYNHTIVGNNFERSDGIRMNGAPSDEWFSLEGFVIASNQMSSAWDSGEIRIHLGDDAANFCRVINGVIANNTMYSDFVGAVIEITDKGSTGTSVADGTLLIADNVINGTDPDHWGVKINADHDAARWNSRTYEVKDNNLTGTDGIYVDGGGMTVVTGNTMSQIGAATDFYAVDVCGQIAVYSHEQAIVRDNFISIGKHISALTNKAVIWVDSPKGTVAGNIVEGHVIAGANGIDTAILLDTGAFNVFDNYYDGVGARWASGLTPLTNELVITGTGSKVGENGMTVDNSGGTGTEFADVDSERWSMAGVVDVKVGELEITWSTDIEILEIESRTKVAPTGTAVIIDAHKNDTTTLYTTQANRPEIATSTKADTTTPDITLVSAGEPVRIDVDQKDSNNVAEGLTVSVRYRRV
jgi:hypothetical protein